MTSLCEIFCGVFLLLSPYNLQPIYSFSSRTFVGKYFINYELKTVQVKDWLGCVNQCLEEPQCISYNFNERNKSCGLNKHGIADFTHADEELLDDAGWIFHQIRPVTMRTNKVVKMSPCPCNCGSSKQCYPPPPGLGDVPEKAAISCKEILQKRRQVPDGAYYLKASPKKRVYCKMTPILDCGDIDTGGWTLVMKINGSESTFSYTANYWTAPDVYYQENYGDDMSEKETKLKTFQLTDFTDMCLGMKTLNGIKWIKITSRQQNALNMFPIFQQPETYAFTIPQKEKWERLVHGATLNDTTTNKCFNEKNGDAAKVRIGILGSQSYIGFGIAGTMGNKISCGYVRIDKNQVIPAFGYILIR